MEFKRVSTSTDIQSYRGISVTSFIREKDGRAAFFLKLYPNAFSSVSDLSDFKWPLYATLADETFDRRNDNREAKAGFRCEICLVIKIR